MSVLLEQACQHWQYVAPLLSKPVTEDDYDRLVTALDELIAVIRDDEQHPLASLAAHLGDLILAYDEAHRPMPTAGGGAVLDFLMRERGISADDLPLLGSARDVDAILQGQRSLDAREMRGLAERFGVPAEVFL